MAKTICPNDPAPSNDTELFGRAYHFTWGSQAKMKKVLARFPHNFLVLHRGKTEDCRRVHYFQNGAKA